MNKLKTAVWCFFRFPKIAVILFVTWWMLRDLPPTSRGGFWFYFWPIYLIGGLFYAGLILDFLNAEGDDE